MYAKGLSSLASERDRLPVRRHKRGSCHPRLQRSPFPASRFLVFPDGCVDLCLLARYRVRAGPSFLRRPSWDNFLLSTFFESRRKMWEKRCMCANREYRHADVVIFSPLLCPHFLVDLGAVYLGFTRCASIWKGTDPLFFFLFFWCFF